MLVAEPLAYRKDCMTETIVPQEILVITGSGNAAKSEGVARRGAAVSALAATLLQAQPVNIVSLQEQVTIFIQQLDDVMRHAPTEAGGFKLAEFEVSAGITVGGKGEVKLALLGGGELSGGVNAGLKFVFKRS